MPRYYEVPPDVVEHYPSLIDDYIRAGTAALRGDQDEYSPWEDIAGQFARGIGTGVDAYTKEYFRERQEERAYNRKVAAEDSRQQQMQERQEAVERTKADTKRQADEYKRAQQMGALQDYFLMRRGSIKENPGFQGIDAEGQIDQRPPRDEVVPPSVDAMESLAEMFRTNPEKAMRALEAMSEVKGPLGNALQSHFGTPQARNLESQIVAREAKGDLDAQKQTALQERFMLELDRRERAMEQKATTDAERIALQREVIEIKRILAQLSVDRAPGQRDLDAARAEAARAAAEKARKGGGEKDYTPLQKTKRRAAEAYVNDKHPNATPEQKAAYIDVYSLTEPWKPDTERGTYLPGQDKPIIINKTTRGKPVLPGQQPEGGELFDRVVERVQKLETISDEGMATLRGIMNRLPPHQQRAIEMILETKRKKK